MSRTEWICQQAQVELTVVLIHAVRDRFKQANMDKPGWFLGNLVTELTGYLDHLPATQTIRELPELTEEVAAQEVLWTKRPSAITQMIANGYDTIEDHRKYLEWMPLSEAREYYYGFPGSRRYTPEEIEQYEQLTSQQEPKRLRLL